MLKTILAVAGRSGLYKLVSKARNMFIVESMTDGKRFPIYAKEKVITLAEISVYTTEEDAPVSGILTKIREKENGGKISIDIPSASVPELRSYFRDLLPNYDEDRVYPSDIRKILSWYNVLLSAGVDDFEAKQDDEAAPTEESPKSAETERDETDPKE
jgi:hypothetical protein